MGRFDRKDPDFTPPDRPREIPWFSILFLAACAFGGVRAYQFLNPTPILRPAGVLVQEEPMIGPASDVKPILYRQYSLIPLASCQLRARVLRTERYFFDRESSLSPIDIALGWQDMSDSRYLDKIKISQGSRGYAFEYNRPPLTRDEMGDKSKNIHALPATEEIEARLKTLLPGHIVRMSGTLVKAEGLDGFTWISSTSTGGDKDAIGWVYWINSLEIEN